MIYVFSLLYVVALLTSMAGMEFLSWAVFFLSLPLLFKRYRDLSINSLAVRMMAAFLLFAFIRESMASQNLVDALKNIDQFRWAFLILSFAAVFKFKQPIVARVPDVLAFVFLVLGVFGIFQLFFGWDPFRDSSAYSNMNEAYPYTLYRVKGLFTSPMTFGNVAAILLSFAAPVLLFSKTEAHWRRWFYRTAYFVFLTNLCLTFSRGAWFAWILTTFVVLAFFRVRQSFKFASVVILMVVVGALVFSPVKRRLLSGVNSNTASVWNRVATMSGHWGAFLEHPLIGNGKKQAFKESGLQQVKKFKYGSRFFSHAHNNQLQLLAEYGLIGFLLFYGSQLALFVWFLRYSLAHRDDFRKNLFFWGGFAGFIAFHMTGLTEATLLDSEVLHSFVFCTALCIASVDRN